MRYKKYVYFLLLVMIFGCNKICAKEIKKCENESDCYYRFNQNDTFMCYNPNKKRVTISYTQVKNGNKDPLINMNKDVTDTETGIDAPKVGNNCPQYLIYRYKDRFIFNSEGIWGFNDSSLANKFFNASNGVQNMQAYIAEKTTMENYNNALTEVFSGGIGKDQLPGIDINSKVSCVELFGEKSDPNSIKYLINEILQYPKIIVPMLVIVFGTVDFAKAVIAGKEDEMKKAQKTFIKRVIIGVAFFFIPVFVDILMSLADIVWEGLGYTACDI